jgi:predicted DNA-binding protein
VASPRLYLRLTERLHARVLAAAEADGSTVSKWVRKAILDTLERSEDTSQAALLAEARRYVTAHPDAYESELISGYVKLLEVVGGRLSLAEQHGRARALAEVLGGALEPLDGEVITFSEYQTSDVPTVLETPVPVHKRGFLREALAREHARALLEAPAAPAGPAAHPALLGEEAARELFRQATNWGNVRSVFCPVHAVVPHAPERPDRCYLGCPIATTDDGPEVT